MSLLSPTLKAAIRLLKAQMRQFIYQAKCQEDENIWAPMLLVERGFLGGALTEWKTILPSWDLTDPATAKELDTILVRAQAQAKSDIVALFHERVPEVATILEGFSASLQKMPMTEKAN